MGLAVGKLRAHKSKSVSDLSKEIVKHWKAAVEKAKAANAPQTGAFPSVSFRFLAFQIVRTAKKPPVVKATGATIQKNELRTFKSDGVKGGTGDITRDKCIELIYDGLACDATARTFFSSSLMGGLTFRFSSAIDHVLAKARGVEAAVYKNMGGTTADYKSKIRSLFVNLKDKANPSLRASVVDGSIAPERFSKMTSQVIITPLPSVSFGLNNYLVGNGIGRAEGCG